MTDGAGDRAVLAVEAMAKALAENTAELREARKDLAEFRSLVIAATQHLAKAGIGGSILTGLAKGLFKR